MCSNSENGHQQHFCLNCLQGFHSGESRKKDFEYCVDNEAVKIGMPEENFLVRFHSGQYQFKAPFVIYTDFEVILQSSEDETELDPEATYVREINCHVPSGFCNYATFAYGKVEDLSSLCGGKDCMEAFCNHIEKKAKRLFHIFSQKADGTPNAGTAERVQ